MDWIAHLLKDANIWMGNMTHCMLAIPVLIKMSCLLRRLTTMPFYLIIMLNTLVCIPNQLCRSGPPQCVGSHTLTRYLPLCQTPGVKYSEIQRPSIGVQGRERCLRQGFILLALCAHTHTHGWILSKFCLLTITPHKTHTLPITQDKIIKHAMYIQI